MDKDGYENYFPECHQEVIRQQEDGNLLFTRVTEYQDEVLSGFEGTYTCNLQGDATCSFKYFGVETKLIYVLDIDYDNYLVSYYCDDTQYKGWREEILWIETRDQDLSVSLPDQKLEEIKQRIVKTLPEL